MCITVSHLQGHSFTAHELDAIRTSTSQTRAQQCLFWHHRVPTVGLRATRASKNSPLAHTFSLWQLAPKKGAGVKIAVIDTGICVRKTNDNRYALHSALPHISLGTSDFLNFANQDAYALVLDIAQRVHPMPERTPVEMIHAYYNSRDVTFPLDCKELIDDAHKKHCFDLCRIGTDKNWYVRELLPITTTNDMRAQHGTALCGIIAGKEHPLLGPIGIAPNADVIIIRACDDYGNSTKKILLQSVKKVQELNIPLVNISLKIDEGSARDEILDNEIARVMRSIAYVVASSGNGVGMAHEAYPARLAHIAFDVGAFKLDDTQHYCIAPFSQYERYQGPKIVAPGCDIITTLVTDNFKKEYAFFHGTSCAAAMITGFMALVLGEFGTRLTREQILKICYQATVRLEPTQEWVTKTLLGTIDMRCALFIMHALCRFRERMMLESRFLCDFDRDFDRLLIMINTLLINFMSSDVVPCFESLSDGVEYIVEKMFVQVQSDKFSLLPLLFSSNSQWIQQRLNSVLNPLSSFSSF